VHAWLRSAGRTRALGLQTRRIEKSHPSQKMPRVATHFGNIPPFGKSKRRNRWAPATLVRCSGISVNTCGRSTYSVKVGRRKDLKGGFLQPILCLRCRREIEAGDKSVAVYIFAQTVGVRPRQKSSANRICFCPQCAVSLAMGLPPEGALNMAAWDMIRELVSADPSLNQAAWEGLRGIVGLLPEGQVEGRFRRAV
jgi:hypothetical protein